MRYLEAQLDGKILRWPLVRGEMTLGRGADCEILIPDESISRRHLALAVSDDQVAVRDLGSTNGLWSDDRRVDAVLLVPEVPVVAGAVVLTMREGVSIDPRPRSNTSRRGHHRGAKPVPGNGATTPTTRRRGVEVAPEQVASAVLADVAQILGRESSIEEILDRLLELIARTTRAAVVALLAEEAAGLALRRVVGLATRDWLLPEFASREPVGMSVVFDETGGAVYCPIPAIGKTRYRLIATRIAREQVRSEELAFLTNLLGPWLALADERAEERATAQSVVSAALETHEPPEAIPRFITVSPSCLSLLTAVERLSRTDIPLLLCGESGTGKELLAARVHALSPRRRGPFVAINCAAIPRELIESELFGIERGVATGVSPRVGQFTLASGGTLFLDEIGELPDSLQPKLLRALEAGEVTPVGANQPVRVDVRIVAATNRDLRERVASGTFRADLLYRIAGATLEIAPLRERPEDILPLATHFVGRLAIPSGQPLRGIAVPAARLLMAYEWPGNARELRHVIARAAALAEGPVLHEGLLPAELRNAKGTTREWVPVLTEAWREARRRFAVVYFSDLLRRCGGNVALASRRAGLSRSELYRKLEELDLTRSVAAAKTLRRRDD